MKRATLCSQKPRQAPLASRDAEYAARKVSADDACDDRVSENIFDVEDERVEVDMIVRRMIQNG